MLYQAIRERRVYNCLFYSNVVDIGMNEPNKDSEKLELYRLKLYKWDKYIASIIPLIVLIIAAYEVEQSSIVLWSGAISLILIGISIKILTPTNFQKSKLLHFISAFGIICFSSICFPFLEYEYFLLPLTVLTILSTYPLQNDRFNVYIGVLCFLTTVVLYFNEISHKETYPQYDSFNSIFKLLMIYIGSVEIVMTALIDRKYREIIEESRITLENQKNELQRYIESNLQLENFAHLASHDLKTPLSNIVKFSQLLKMKIGHKLAEDESELFDFIIDGSKRMNNTIGSLFKFSQASNTKLSLSKFEFNAFIEEIIADLGPSIEEKKATINLLTEPVEIRADKPLFFQIWYNLIINSLKFAKRDVPPVLNISVESLQREWLFTLEDNGIGIQPDYLESIFVLFKRLHPDSHIEGTGAGLAICKTIIQHHQGRIWAESNGSSGSTFCLILPNQ